jgi:hypothetical protein
LPTAQELGAARDPVARRNVVDDRVAGDVAHRLSLFDVACSPADDDCQLDLPVVHLSNVEKGDRGAGTAQRIAGALDE